MVRTVSPSSWPRGCGGGPGQALLSGPVEGSRGELPGSRPQETEGLASTAGPAAVVAGGGGVWQSYSRKLSADCLSDSGNNPLVFTC